MCSPQFVSEDNIKQLYPVIENHSEHSERFTVCFMWTTKGNLNDAFFVGYFFSNVVYQTAM